MYRIVIIFNITYKLKLCNFILCRTHGRPMAQQRWCFCSVSITYQGNESKAVVCAVE